MTSGYGEAVALTGFAVWQLVATYTHMAPTLGDLRTNHADDTEHRQRLLDADMCVGGTSLLAGIAATWISRSWVPIALVLGAFAWVSFYHHAALSGPTPEQLETE
jgi:hypothetical protein